MLVDNLMKQETQPLLVFAEDWGRHPSSCQHLVGHLLNRYEVCWVNTIGMRRPRLDTATLSRGIEKIRHWLRRAPDRGRGESSHPVPPHLHILNPWMWPSFGSRLERCINRELLVRQLNPIISAMPVPPIALTNIPIVADLIGSLPVRRWVYYCVDDFAEWPGLDGTTLRTLEERLIERADVLIAVSPTLREKLGPQRRPVHLLTHGVDLDIWGLGDALAPQFSAGSLDGLERPLIVFWGLVDRRMDITFIERLSNEPDERNHFAGWAGIRPTPELGGPCACRAASPSPVRATSRNRAGGSGADHALRRPPGDPGDAAAQIEGVPGDGQAGGRARPAVDQGLGPMP